MKTLIVHDFATVGATMSKILPDTDIMYLVPPDNEMFMFVTAPPPQIKYIIYILQD